MKKSILTIAAAATMVAPAIVMADATLYGNVHLSINQFDEGTAVGTGVSDISTLDPTLTGAVPGNRGSRSDELDMTSNTSAIGVKGSEALGDGLKAIYKMEFGVDTADSGAITGRDQFVGLKGGMGTIKFGTMSSNYKQMGGKVDALYRTQLEGRQFINTQSAMNHGGRGINRGRQTNTVQYSSPKMGGVQLVLNTTVSGADDETMGAGIRWSNKNALAFVDFIDGPVGSVTDAGGDAVTESAVKVGGRYKTKAFSVGGQYEDAEDRTGFNYVHLNGAYNINKNNAIILTVGQATHVDIDDQDTTGVALVYNHKLSKMTNVYLGYGDRSSDTDGLEDSLFTAGIKKKF